MSAGDILESLLAQLPEWHAPRVLYDRLVQSSANAQAFERDSGLLADVLTLAAWSPWLAATLEHNPDYVHWLQRERLDPRVRTREDLSEALGRFALTHSTLDPHDIFARFRRRELLRIYLNDIRRIHTIAETTEELSNLADTILEYALRLSRQRLDNRYGAPQRTDSEGRITGTEFSIVALGKLGSRELNYASDIDLVFLFSHEGTTSGVGADEAITNREYFVKLAEQILRLVSEPTGEGAAYRVDVRLRPYGREGALACGLEEAVKYYETKADDWELQTLIRARCAAGSEQLSNEFLLRVRNQVYRPNVSVVVALESVRLSKQKIDIQRERTAKGFNVKLGRGGIREIEFIAQALQLAFGGRDSWLRAPHTLISLARLTDRGLLSEAEYSQLSNAYQWWRALEHRLQMEHGLQTHSVPIDPARRELIARRMNFGGDRSLEQFEATMTSHAKNVRAVFERIFAGADGRVDIRVKRAAQMDPTLDPDTASAAKAAAIFAKLLDAESLTKAARGEDYNSQLASFIRDVAESSLNTKRGLRFALRVAKSLEKEKQPQSISLAELDSLIRLCSVSEPFGEMLAARPVLIHATNDSAEKIRRRNYRSEFGNAVCAQTDFRDELDKLRQHWSAALVEIGAADAAAHLKLNEVNRQLTELATASIDAALAIAQRELKRRHGRFASAARLAILGLGRLGSAGMDYASDLDIIAVYDSASPSPLAGFSHEEAYARLIELMIAALSNLTREGSLYRVDLRLRPDGQKGPIACSADSFSSYLKQRAAIWEWLAYVKLRSIAGDCAFGSQLQLSARARIHEMAQRLDPKELLSETRHVRARLEIERAPRRRDEINIKHGAGGMLDVYFAVRYLQLRDNVPDDEEDRTTVKMLKQLCAAGSLDEQSFRAFDQGYRLLRSVDHEIRLIAGRSATLRAVGHPAMDDIARRLNYETPELLSELKTRMTEIRAAHNRIFGAA